jgi:Flp pilus assembly protein TadD
MMADDWAVGDRIGGLYEVREILGGPGRSGMATVFVCHYRWHQKDYALKTYQDRFAWLEWFTQAFHLEATLWMGLGAHPNIVRAHWVHRLDGRIFIVMEYVPQDNAGRRTLADHLAPGRPLPPLRTLVWALQFCDGMAHAAAEGIDVHRDIKPDNILITLDKTLKVTDFGLARAFGEAESAGGMAGTPLWMAPEQFEPGAPVTVRADVYAFGLVLYQMATGRPPFVPPEGPDAVPAIRRWREVGAVAPFDGPLLAITSKCLAPDPADRWTDFNALREGLAGVWVEQTALPLPVWRVPPAQNAREANQYGVALKHLGRPDDALAWHDMAIGMDPVFPNAWNDKGVALWDLGRTDEARACFDQAVALDPEFVHPHTNRAALLGSLGDSTAALAGYDAAVAADPDFINAWRGRGDLLLELGRTAEAITCFERALTINRRDAWSRYRKGCAHLRQAEAAGEDDDQRAAAMNCLRAVLALTPFLPEAGQLLQRIEARRPPPAEGGVTA